MTHMILKNYGGVQVNNIVLRSLMFADDLVLFSHSSEGLKSSLMALESYCNSIKTNRIIMDIHMDIREE